MIILYVLLALTILVTCKELINSFKRINWNIDEINKADNKYYELTKHLVK